MMIMRPPQQGHGCRRLRLRLLRAARLFAFLRSFLWSFPKLLAWLRQRTKLARVHVFDHTLTQRGDGLGCHRQRLSWMRLLTPRSSRQGASPATHHLYPGDNPEPVGQQAAQSVSAAWSWLRLFSSEQRTRWNPAELLIAALSACHQLWYLHLCADAGIVVVAYSDDASGVEIEQSAELGAPARRE